MSKKKKPVCSRCGSDEILVDAYASWDADKQEWVLHATYDDTCCNACGHKDTEKWEEIE